MNKCTSEAIVNLFGIILIFVIFIVFVNFAYKIGKDDGYKNGQIDAINNIIKYEQQEEKIWKEIDVQDKK